MTAVDAATPVRTERHGEVLAVVLDRPERRNAINLRSAELIAEALDELDGRDDLRAAVITGSGGTFSAGMDLVEFRSGVRPVLPGRGFAGFTEAPPRKPVIAAVEGWALGGGFEMVLACDLVVAARGARFGLPEVSRGLAARGGGLLRLPKRIPTAIAFEVLLTGDPLDAERAAHYGLVNEVVADGQAFTAALALADRIARNAPLAIMASKAVATRTTEWTDDEGFTAQDAYLDPVFASDDAREGVRAFAEHRPPAWTGR